MDKVDFFIAGAPKCGTTALAVGLSKNPKVVFCRNKEPHFFSTDFYYDRKNFESEHEYIKALFPPKKEAGSVWGDASVWHLASEVALKRIYDFNPKSKIVVLLRDPAKAAFSLHQMRCFQGLEPVRDFSEAWSLSQERFDRVGFSAPGPKTVDPRLIAYRHAYTFHPQLTRLFEIFPEENIKLLRQEDFRIDGKNVLKSVNSFLGVSDFDFPEPTSENANFYMKDGPWIRLLQNKTFWGPLFRMKRALKIKSFGIGRPTVRISSKEIDLVHRDLAEDISAVYRDFGLDIGGKGKFA